MKGALRLLRKVFAVLTRPVLLYPLTGLFWGGFILLTILVREEIEIGAWKWPPSLAKPGELLTDFENQSIDWRFHWRGPEEASPDIMILAISNSSLTGTTFSDQELAANPDLKLLETWPWPRKAWSKIIERLLASGAKMVALDVVFSTPSKAGAQDDLALQKTIWKHRDRLVLGATYKKPAPGVPSELLLPNDTLLEPFEHDEEIVALVNYEYSSGTIREMPTRELDLKYDYMASLVAKKAGWAKGSSPDLFFINYAGPGGSFKTVDLYKIFYPAAWNRELQGGKVFKDKVIFIGGTASIFQDLHFTPFGITPGVEIHANALANFHDRPMLERFSALTVLLVAGFLQGLFLSL
ncbi:MAG: CHASE2 domain-containing protein, partial [Verrucomicrobiae bacterium]|nr:CHASE2 domain-containing protein [Verrucomicrobiae bacterium]